MIIVDNLKKARNKALEQIKNGHGNFSTSFLVELTKEMVKVIEEEQRIQHLK